MSVQGEHTLVTSPTEKSFLLHHFFAAGAMHRLLCKPSFPPSSLPPEQAESSFWIIDLTPPGLAARIPRAPRGRCTESVFLACRSRSTIPGSLSLSWCLSVLATSSTFPGPLICVSVTGSLFLQQHKDSQPLTSKEGSRTDTSTFADFRRQISTTQLLGCGRSLGVLLLHHTLGLLVRSN